MQCRECGRRLRLQHTMRRKVATVAGMLRLKVSIRRCEDQACARYHVPRHPLEEGHLALPYNDYGRFERLRKEHGAFFLAELVGATTLCSITIATPDPPVHLDHRTTP